MNRHKSIMAHLLALTMAKYIAGFDTYSKQGRRLWVIPHYGTMNTPQVEAFISGANAAIWNSNKG